MKEKSIYFHQVIRRDAIRRVSGFRAWRGLLKLVEACRGLAVSEDPSAVLAKVLVADGTGFDGLRRAKSITNESSWSNSDDGTHCMSSSPYPFHRTKYWTFFRWRRESSIFPTSYAVESLVSGGGRARRGRPENVSGATYGMIRST